MSSPSSRLAPGLLHKLAGLAPALLLAACAALPFLPGAFAMLCPFEAMIPAAGAPLASTCPGQDAVVAAGIAAAEKAEAPPPGTSVELVAGDAGEPHAYVYALSASGKQLVGHGPCHPRAPVDGGAEALPQAPAVLPVVSADAGPGVGR